MIRIIEIEKGQLDAKLAQFLKNFRRAVAGTSVTIEPVIVIKSEIAALESNGDKLE